MIDIEKIDLIVDGSIYSLQKHGGISRNFNALLSALCRTGQVDLTLVLPSGTVCPEDLSGMASVCYSPSLKNWRPGRVMAPVNRYRARRAETSFWSSFKKGVYQSTYYSTHSGIRIPQVLSFQDAIYEQFPDLFGSVADRRHIEARQQSVAAAAAIIFPSEASLRECTAFYEIDGKQKLVVPYAVDSVFLSRPNEGAVERFRQKWAGNEPYLLHSGGRYLHKNFSFLLEAYARWDGRNRFRLLSVGGGPWTPEEEARINELGLKDRVIALPRLDETDLVTAYYAAAAFIFPSLCEGFGFPLIEAMAVGLPVAAAQAGSLPEVGKDVPVYFDPREEKEILRALNHLENEMPNRARWDRGRSLAESRSWDDVAQDVLAFYKQGLGRED